MRQTYKKQLYVLQQERFLKIGTPLNVNMFFFLFQRNKHIYDILGHRKRVNSEYSHQCNNKIDTSREADPAAFS